MAWHGISQPVFLRPASLLARPQTPPPTKKPTLHLDQSYNPPHVRINSANLGNAAIFSSGLVVSAKKISRWFLSFLLFFSSLGAASLVTSLMRSSTELDMSPFWPGGNAPGGGAPKPGRGGSAPGCPGMLPGRVGMAVLTGEKGCGMPWGGYAGAPGGKPAGAPGGAP